MQQSLNIKELRENLGESQEVFACRFGVTQTAVSLWERKGPPSRGIVRKMLEDLNQRSLPTPKREGEAAA